SESPIETRESARQKDKPCAGYLRGTLEIHLSERLAERKMFAGRAHHRRGTEPARDHLHIVRFVCAIRDVSCRQIAKRGDFAIKRALQFALLLFAGAYLLLEPRDFGHERRSATIVLLCLGCSDLAGRLVAASLAFLQTRLQ